MGMRRKLRSRNLRSTKTICMFAFFFAMYNTFCLIFLLLGALFCFLVVSRCNTSRAIRDLIDFPHRQFSPPHSIEQPTGAYLWLSRLPDFLHIQYQTTGDQVVVQHLCFYASCGGEPCAFFIPRVLCGLNL